MFPGQMRYIIASAASGSATESLPSELCPVNLQREASRRHPNQTPDPPQLAAFEAKEQQLYSELPRDARAQGLSPAIIWRKLVLGNSVALAYVAVFFSGAGRVTVFISRVTKLFLVTPSRIAFETVYFPSKVNWLKYKNSSIHLLHNKHILNYLPSCNSVF